MQPIQFFAARAEDGALLPGATVEVFVTGTETRAALFADNAGSTPLANPTAADESARVFFYTTADRIDIEVRRGGYIAPLLRDMLVKDPTDVLAETVAEAVRGEAAADRADAAALEAESLAAAAFAAGNLYVNAAGGVDPTNGVPSGALFLVQTEDPQVFDKYVNLAGSASQVLDSQGNPEQFEVASSSLVREIDRRTIQNRGTKAVHVFEDVNGDALGHFREGGGLHLGADEKSVQERLSLAPEATPDSNIEVLEDAVGDAVRHTDSEGEQFLAGLDRSVQKEIFSAKAAGWLAFAAQFVGSDSARSELRVDVKRARADEHIRISKELAPHGIGGTTWQRIPTQIQTDSHGLLVIWGPGIPGYDGDSYGVKLARMNVEVDLDMRSVAAGEYVVMEEPSWAGGVVKHPALGKVLAGDNAGRIILATDDTNASQQATIYEIKCRISSDDGQTFGAPFVIAVPPEGAGSKIVSGSTGSILTIPDGQFAGRLVLPLYGYDAVAGSWFICTIYSDEDGSEGTWVLGNRLMDGQVRNETSIAWCEDGSILFTSRNESTPGIKAISRSTDGGQTLVPLPNSDDLVGSNCAPSALGVDRKVLHFAPENPDRRIEGRIRVSYDNGSSFPLSYEPFRKGYYMGYSSLIALNETTFSLVYEGDENGNFSNKNGNLYILIVNTKELLENGSHI